MKKDKEPSPENAVRDYYTKLALTALFLHGSLNEKNVLDNVKIKIERAAFLADELLEYMGPPPEGA